MSEATGTLGRLQDDRRGNSAIEYVALLLAPALVIVYSLTQLGQSANSTFEVVNGEHAVPVQQTVSTTPGGTTHGLPAEPGIVWPGSTAPGATGEVWSPLRPLTSFDQGGDTKGPSTPGNTNPGTGMPGTTPGTSSPGTGGSSGGGSTGGGTTGGGTTGGSGGGGTGGTTGGGTGTPTQPVVTVPPAWLAPQIAMRAFINGVEILGYSGSGTYTTGQAVVNRTAMAPGLLVYGNSNGETGYGLSALGLSSTVITSTRQSQPQVVTLWATTYNLRLANGMPVTELAAGSYLNNLINDRLGGTATYFADMDNTLYGTGITVGQDTYSSGTIVDSRNNAIAGKWTYDDYFSLTTTYSFTIPTGMGAGQSISLQTTAR